MRKDINGDMIFSTIGGYLAVISGTNMYLGDNRLTTKVRGMEQYKWFPIRNVGGYEGDSRNYYYARSEISGIYSHPDLGKATDETVMSYVDENGEKQVPIMVHRVCFGSIERFIGIITEHFAGKFPVWLAPVQVKVLPISDNQLEYARKVAVELDAKGIRVEIDDRQEKIGYKIREAQLSKVPYMLILGEKEVEAGAVGVRARAQGDIGAMKLEEFISKIKVEIENYVR